MALNDFIAIEHEEMLGMPYTRLPGKGHSSHLMVLRASQHAMVSLSCLAPQLWENFVLFHLLVVHFLYPPSPLDCTALRGWE